MRDLLITSIFLWYLIQVPRRPVIGMYLWAWFSYMNPHRLAYGFAYSFPFAMVIAVVALPAIFFSKDTEKPPLTSVTVFMALLIIWMTVTSVYAYYPEAAWTQYKKVIKILFMSLVCISVVKDKESINNLIAIIVASIGYFGVKGGIFTLKSGGQFRVWGPSGSFIEGNNEIALALLMVIPLANYLRLSYVTKWRQQMLLGVMLFMLISAIGSQSRGALLAAGSMLAIFWWKSKGKLVSGVAVLIVAAGIYMFMPQSWHDRMGTIETYEQDNSAMGRINSWMVAINVAKERVTGGGFETFGEEIFKMYAPNPADIHDAHSIYFEVLGEHGFVGLFLFLSIILMTFLNAAWVIKHTKDVKEFIWANDLARMFQVCLVAYTTGGAFLGLAYFDLFWHIVVLSVIVKHIVQKSLKAPEVSSVGAK